ncbi:MAG TPA: hypothetical protein VIA06_00385 [Candidatus Dormibacteraeota bacterium]|jgi:hypothetical protein|nr:hypothetical protein [Candidatus Dormibacteraeota bacterium]
MRMGLRKTLLVAGLGAAAAYFLDPVSGRERRERLQVLIDGAMQKAPNLPLPIPMRSSGASAAKPRRSTKAASAATSGGASSS